MLIDMGNDEAPEAASRLAIQAPMKRVVRRVVTNYGKIILYVILILLCVLFAPEEPLKFIYTEF